MFQSHIGAENGSAKLLQIQRDLSPDDPVNRTNEAQTLNLLRSFLLRDFQERHALI